MRELARNAPGRPHPDLPRRRLPVLLRRAWYGLNQAFRRRIAHTGITPDQYTVLRNLKEAGITGLAQCQLCDQMTSDPNTVAALANRMSAAGLIERQTDPKDRRALRLRLSPEGKRRFRQLQQLATVLQREVLEGVSKTERARFLDQLDRVAAACRMAAEQSPNRQAARPRRGAARE